MLNAHWTIGKVMASPDHQIPVSAEIEAKDEKQTESRKEFDNATSNQQTKEGQVTEVVFDLSCTPSIKDTFQSQAHVPQTDKLSDTKEDEAPDLQANEVKLNERDISRAESMSNQATEAAHLSKSVLSPLCSQGVEDTFQTKAQVPPAGMKPDADFSGTKTANAILTSEVDTNTRFCTQGDEDIATQPQAQVNATGMKSVPYEAADRKEDIQASPHIVVSKFQAGILGVSMVSQLTLSRGGAALTAETFHTAVELSTLNAALTTKATTDDPCKGSQGGTCTFEQKLYHDKAVVLSTLNAVMTTSKATADDHCKGSQGGTCTFGADVKGYQYISVWVAQPPPPNTGGPAPAWPPPLRLSNIRAAARRNSISTAVRAQIKAVLG